MAKIHASWIHGVSVQAQREGYFISASRPGYGAHFNTHGKEWFHFAVPTPVLVAGQRSKVKKVFVLFKTEGTAKIVSVHVYDAGKKLKSFDNLSRSGNHSDSVDAQNSWSISPAVEMQFGLGISVEVDFGAATTGAVPGIWFRTAGADFETP